MKKEKSYHEKMVERIEIEDGFRKEAKNLFEYDINEADSFVEAMIQITMDNETAYKIEKNELSDNCMKSMRWIFKYLYKYMIESPIENERSIKDEISIIINKVEDKLIKSCNIYMSFYTLKNISLEELLIVGPHIQGMIWIIDLKTSKMNVVVIMSRSHIEKDERSRILFMSCEQCLISLMTRKDVMICVGQIYGDYRLAGVAQKGGLCYLTAVNAILKYMGCESLSLDERALVAYERTIYNFLNSNDECKTNILDVFKDLSKKEGYRNIKIKNDRGMYEYLLNDQPYYMLQPLGKLEKDVNLLGEVENFKDDGFLKVSKGTEYGCRLYRGKLFEFYFTYLSYNRFLKDESELKENTEEDYSGRFKIMKYCILYPKDGLKKNGEAIVNYKDLFMFYPELIDKAFLLGYSGHIVFHNPILHNMIDMNWDMTSQDCGYTIEMGEKSVEELIRKNTKDNVPKDDLSKMVKDIVGKFGILKVVFYQCKNPSSEIMESSRYGYVDPFEYTKYDCEGHECYNKSWFRENISDKIGGGVGLNANSKIYKVKKKIYDYVNRIKEMKPGERIKKANKEFLDEIRNKKGMFIPNTVRNDYIQY